MKMKILLVFCLFAFIACREIKSPEEDIPVVDPSFNIEVPAGFDWDVHKSVEISVRILDQYDARLDYAIEIYDGTALLERGLVKGDEMFSAVVNVQKNCTDLTIVQVDPNEDRYVVNVSIVGNSVNFDFATDIPLTPEAIRSSSRLTVPDGAIKVTENMVLKPGIIYFVNSYIRNVNIVKGVTMYITAPGGNFQISPEAEWEDSDIYVEYGSKIVGLTPKSVFSEVNIFNEGQVHIYGDYHFSDSKFVNGVKGEVFFANLKFTGASVIENNNIMLVGGKDEPTDWKKETSGKDWNKTGTLDFGDAKITVGREGSFRAKNILSNGGEINLLGHSWIWANETINLVGTKIKKSVDGDDRYAVILANNFSVSQKTDVVGEIILDAKGGITPSGDGWDSDIKIGKPDAKVVSIPSTEYRLIKYNDGGYNHVDPNPIPKPDVIEYFEPSYTIVMEDSYPEVGDMDMNDIVCEWQMGTLKDGNKVTKLGLNYTVKALGSTRELAAAVALTGLAHSDIKKITVSKQHNFGKYFEINAIGVETQNSDVVIPLFENVHATCFGKATPNFVNTFNVTEDYYNFKVEIEFVTPMEQTKISRDSINFFIVTGGDKSKRTEIHLYGNSPTAKASNNQAVFNDNKVIWGVELVADFAYSRELIPINQAYKNFDSWVKSGGVENTDWYKIPTEGKVIKSLK